MANRQPDQHIQHVLRQALVYGSHNAPTVSRRSGLGYDLLAKLWSGERHLLAEHLPKLYRGTQDLDLFAELSGARECDLIVSRRGEATGEQRAPSSKALEISAASGRVAQAVADAMANDGEIDEAEAREILAGLEALERRAVALRRTVSPVRAIASGR